MGAFGSDATSTTSNVQQGASDQGILISANKSTTLLNSLLFQNSKLNSGIDVSALLGGKVNLTVNDLGQVNEILATISASQGEGLAKITDVISSANKEAQEKLKELALSVSTGGESKRDTTILWVVAVIVAGLAAIFIWRRRRHG